MREARHRRTRPDDRHGALQRPIGRMRARATVRQRARARGGSLEVTTHGPPSLCRICGPFSFHKGLDGMPTSLAPQRARAGTKVLIRWNDGMFYPGTILSTQRKGKSTLCEVKYAPPVHVQVHLCVLGVRMCRIADRVAASAVFPAVRDHNSCANIATCET